ncbi:MAG: lipopolysaccharide heptosyltransferase II [Acidobacteria bacterium]|nr:lipopolysaccharide heptosyltransferase II [Acidobacteriota bacterium]
MNRLLVRATNWVGDAVMSLPALRAIRERFPKARISVLALDRVGDLYGRESFADEVIPYTAERGRQGWRGKRKLAAELRERRFEGAILLQNAFEAALIAWMARIPVRIGYNRDGRRLLLTHAIDVPGKDEIPRHESFYYLELLRRAGLLEKLPREALIRLEGAAAARGAGVEALRARGLEGAVVGVSPGAAYGNAKRWLPERFAEAAAMVASTRGASVALFGVAGERELCEAVGRQIERLGVPCCNLAGETSLKEFIDLAAACAVMVTNDSGAMHIASALEVPTVAVFGATDHEATGPAGPLARIVREPVECSPCLLRECPIDHRCMTRVPAERVAHTALELLK